MQHKLGEYDKNDLYNGLIVLLELEDESHKWITSGITEPPPKKNINETLVYQYVLKLYPYVVENTLVLEESEFSEIKLSDHYRTMPYGQAIKGLFALVNRFAFYDFRTTLPRNIDTATPLIRFTWEAYLRYRLDTFTLNRYEVTECMEQQADYMPLFTYEEIAFLTGVQVSTIENAIDDLKIKKVKSPTGHRMLSFNNSYLNEALSIDVVPHTQRRAFIPADSALTWLACRGVKRTSFFYPTKVISNDEIVIPAYWERDFWKKLIKALKRSFPEKHKAFIGEIKNYAGISFDHSKKLERGTTGLHLGQAILIDDALIKLIDLENTSSSDKLSFLNGLQTVSRY